MSVHPNDPITALAAAAASTHEMFRAYLEAGFSESQALYLTAACITASIRPTPPQP